jgi:hypothetical protein
MFVYCTLFSCIVVLSFHKTELILLTLTSLDSLLFTWTHQKCMVSDDPEMEDEKGRGEDSEDFGVSLHTYK